MRRRTGTLLAGAAVVVALVSGCGGGPSRVDAAAVIGSDTITLSEVQPKITAALDRPDLIAQLRTQGIGPPDVGRAVVNRLIVHDLLERAAAEQRIVVRDDQVDAAIAAAGGEQVLAASSVDPSGVRDQIRDQLIATRIAEKEIDRLSVVADVAITRDREQALTIGRALAAGGPAADRALAGAETAQRGVKIRPATTPQVAPTPLVGIPAGDTAVFQTGSQQQGWIVVRVTQRTLDAAPAGPPAASRLDPQTLSEVGLRLIGPLAERVGVTVNPRYGTWDPVMLALVPQADQAGQLIKGAPAAG